MNWSLRIILITFALMLVGGLLGAAAAGLVPVSWSEPATTQPISAGDVRVGYRYWGVIVGALLGLVAAAIYFFVRARGKRTTAYRQI